MFDHVTIRVSDRHASRRFYATVLGTLGRDVRREELFDEWDEFSIAQASEEHPATRRLHVGFAARSRDEVDAFWHAGVDAGHESDGEPGPRPIYHERYYGAFLLDPDGNSVEAVHHGRRPEEEAIIDHLWLRVADAAASRRFYEALEPVLGLGLRDGRWGPTIERGECSFTLLDGPPTENVHLAFPVADNAGVGEFHRAALAAGYRDNGAPGERPIYHPGYYGAFVLDPDGNNVEAVCHNR